MLFHLHWFTRSRTKDSFYNLGYYYSVYFNNVSLKLCYQESVFSYEEFEA